jgi:hypothetical protein
LLFVPVELIGVREFGCFFGEFLELPSVLVLAVAVGELEYIERRKGGREAGNIDRKKRRKERRKGIEIETHKFLSKRHD